MRKCCGKCIYSKPITSKDVLEGYKADGVVRIDKSRLINAAEDKVICVLRNSVHRRNKEQRKCTDFDVR